MVGSSANAITIEWVDWTSGSGGSATGSVAGIGVTYSGPNMHFIQTGAGTNYWAVDAAYLAGDIDNAPPGNDIIALNAGGISTITFDLAVVDPVIALVSWNGNVVDFGTAIEVVSVGTGHWGTGSFTNVTATGFSGDGELHGVVRILGQHTTISFTHTAELWHGFQVGIEALATEAPEVTPLALLGAGVVSLGLVRRRS